MWTRAELIEIRKRAELEASIEGHKESWRYACLALAAAADRLDAITARIENDEETAVEEDTKPQSANGV